MMMGLPDGRKSFKIDLAFQTQNRRVHPASHLSTAKDRAYALCCASKKRKDTLICSKRGATEDCWASWTEHKTNDWILEQLNVEK